MGGSAEGGEEKGLRRDAEPVPAARASGAEVLQGLTRKRTPNRNPGRQELPPSGQANQPNLQS